VTETEPCAGSFAVWILDDGLIMGGGQRFALRLAGVLRRSGIQTRLLAPADSALAEEARRRGLDVADVRFPRLLPPAVTRIPAALTGLRRELARATPNTVVIGNTARCQAYATSSLLTMRRWPVLVHLMHEQDSANRRTARAVYRRFGVLVAVGENAAQTYRERLPGVEVATVSNFLDMAEMRRIEAARTPAPSPGAPVVGVLARLIPEKGVLELVEELAQIPDAWSSARIAAPPQDVEYTRAVRGRIAALGLTDRIHLLGEVSDLDRFFAEVDVLVVPSVGNEGQPTVIIESLLYGRPVIVRRHLWAQRFEDLPISSYAQPRELASALAAAPGPQLSAEELELRFGANEVLETLRRLGFAASSPITARPSYFDWHQEPGYYRDVTRHFATTDRILDVGCGTAWIGDHFDDYVGIDDSEEAVEQARARGRNALVHSVNEPFPFEDSSFDGVVVKDLLEHVRDPAAVVREIRRVLRPGGRVFASSPDAQRWVWDDYTHMRPFTRVGYRRLFADQGLAIETDGYESVMPGIGLVSGVTRRRRRPRLLAELARLPIIRRNVWVLARRPD
jgi:SAM-dependent methyltransferase/glycosyltransferase involved in cell wall biosynthesis